jgi:DNA-binding SARP family transcriptional activator
MLIGILYGAPGHKQLRRCVERVSEMLDENLDVNSKLTAATYLLSYCNLAGELELGRSVLQRASPLLGSEQLTPLNELWWHLRLAHFHTMVGDLSAADAALAHVRHVAATHGLNGLRSAALLTRSYEQVVACMQGDRARVQRLAGELEALARPNRPQDMFHVVDGKMYGATLNADARALCSGGPVSYNAGLAAGMVYIQVLSLVRWAHGAALAGDRDTLEECVRRTRCLIAGTYLTYFECEIRLLQAYAALAHRHALDAPACIRQALVYAREHRFHYPNNVRFSATLLHVLDAALREGVEVNYAREIIARYRLRPINGLNVEWPWPIRLFTLGRFEVQIEGSPLRFPGKTPRKPLALLKAIVAHGGHEVPQARLIDALWPNEDGDAGKHALGVTIVRLRKLLGSHDALTVADERVSLNDSVCWVDALAFEAKLRHSGDAMDAASEAAIIRIQEALAMYKGAFLPSDTDEPWSVQFRLRLRGLFTASVEDLGAQHEARREWDRAIAWYRRGLEADDLIEEFYLGQMRCFLALQRPAEGLAVFRRLRQTLAVVLGLAPSPASEAMARTLSQSNQSVSG